MIPFPDHVFAVSSIDESWKVEREKGRLIARHLSRGAAIARSRPGAAEIRATDRAAELVHADVLTDLERRAQTAARGANALLARLGPVGCDARILSTSRYVIAGDVEDITTDVSIAVACDGISFVSTPDFLLEDVARIHGFATADLPPASADPESMPVVWRNGTGGVLLHEAAGHAAEEGVEPIAWPSWLNVFDEPRGFPIDDCGSPTTASDLLHESPRSFRRASFGDVPAQRMTTVVVTSSAPPVEMPSARIEVYAVGGGRYDRVSDSIRVDVSLADVVLVSGERRRAKPFRYFATRGSIARHISAASSTVTRYPGVICGAEGVRVRVGTESVDLVTEPS